MSECPPPPVVGDAAGRGPEALSPEAIEAVLTDFRAWLQRLPAAETALPAAEAEPIDLHTLLGQFIALRHEVNLQTRATRGQQEQNAEALRLLSEALDALHQNQEAGHRANAQAREEQVRPILKALVDVYDALTLAWREIQRSQQAIDTALEQLTDMVEPNERGAPTGRPSLWARWFGGRSNQLDRQQEAEAAAAHVWNLIEALVIGYTMSLQRVERAMQQQGLEPISCVGLPFDPEQMEVVEDRKSVV